MLNSKKLNHEYDSSVDALYIEIDGNHKNIKAITIDDNVILDFTKEGKFIGLEILNTSKVLNTTIESLKNILDIDLILKVTKHQILVNAIFKLPIDDHDEFKITNVTAVNDSNIPIMDTKIATA